MRATNGASRHKMIKRIKKRASGYFSGRSKMYRVICEAVRRAEVQGFAGRKLKKRQFRQLWIKRVSIECRKLGVSYSRLIAGLEMVDIRLDRKQLSELAIHQPAAFTEIVEKVKVALATQAKGADAFGLNPSKGGRDNLELVEGIGPKISELLFAAGISTFAKLAATSAEAIQEILAKAGSKFAMAKPGTWPQQANLAATGQWAAFKQLKDELVGGVAK